MLSAGFLCFQPEGTVRFPSLVFLRFHCLFRWYVFCLVLRNICCPFVLHGMVALHLFRVSRQSSSHLQFPAWCFLAEMDDGQRGGSPPHTSGVGHSRTCIPLLGASFSSSSEVEQEVSPACVASTSQSKEPDDVFLQLCSAENLTRSGAGFEL